MWAPRFIKSYFNERAERRHITQQANKLRDTILDRAASREQVIAAAEDIDHIPPKMTNSLIRAAVSRDDLEIFQMVLDKTEKGSATTKLCERETILEAGSYYTEQSLLYVAIKSDAPNIAQILAADPKIDPADSGYSSSTRYTGYVGGSIIEKREQYPAPFDLALEHNMPEVANILKDRLSAKMSQKISAHKPKL